MIRKVTRFEHCYKPLAVWPDAEDIQLHQENCSSHLITQRLRELVPLFDFIRNIQFIQIISILLRFPVSFSLKIRTIYCILSIQYSIDIVVPQTVGNN